MDMRALRQVLAPLVERLKDHGTEPELPGICANLGLAYVSDAASKRLRVAASLAAAPDADLPTVASRLLATYPPDAVARNRLQDVLYADGSGPSVPKRYRRELARALDVEMLFAGGGRFENLLDRLWILDTDPFGGILAAPRGLRESIRQHVFNNPGDWSAEDLFNALGAFDATDWRFMQFVEGLASADVLTDESSQRRFVATANEVLKGCNVCLRESGSVGGYQGMFLARDLAERFRAIDGTPFYPTVDGVVAAMQDEAQPLLENLRKNGYKHALVVRRLTLIFPQNRARN